MPPTTAALRLCSAVALGFILAACGGGDDGGGGPTPSFEIGVSPPSLTLQAGGLGSAEASVRASGDITVSIARGLDFTGPITVTVEGLPAGVTASALTIATGQTSGTVTITASGTAAAGNATLVVRGSGSGVASKTANVALTVTAAPGFTLALSPATISVAQGASGTTQVTLTRSGGFVGSVDFSATGMPAGMTVGFAPPSTTGTSTTATVTVGSGVNAGSYQISLRGTFALLPVQSATLTVNVTAASPGNFDLAVLPNQLTIQQGQSANATLSITRTGSFTGPVTFTATSQPAGLNVTFNPATAPGANSTVQVAVPGSQAAGAYVVTIQGNGAPVGERTTTLTVNVTSTPGGTTVNYVFCAESGIPSWFAYQTGSGAGASQWTAVPVQAGNVFSFVHPFGTTVGSVAYVIEAGGKSTLTMVSAATSELVQQGSSGLCPAAPGSKTVNGSVTGMGASEVATVSMGTRSTQVFSAVPGGAFTLTNVEDGGRDLLVSVYNTTNSVTNRLGLRRNQNPANNATLAPFNVQTEGAAPVNYTLTYNNRDVDLLQVTALYRTANGTSGLLFAGPQGPASTQLVPGMPGAQQVASDLHMSLAIAVPASHVNGYPNRTVTSFYLSASNRTFTLAPPIADPVITTLATVPYVRPQASQNITADLKDFFQISWVPASGSVAAVNISATFAFYGAGPFLAALPDFTGTTGWNNAWGLPSGVPIAWTTTAAASNVPGGIGVPAIQDGTIVRTASRAGARTF